VRHMQHLYYLTEQEQFKQKKREREMEVMKIEIVLARQSEERHLLLSKKLAAC